MSAIQHQTFQHLDANWHSMAPKTLVLGALTNVPAILGESCLSISPC